MKIIDSLQDENGNVYAFEIDYWYVTPRQIAQLLSGIDQVTNIRVRRPFSFSEIYVEFQYQGEAFEMWDEGGESISYWIGPKEGLSACQVDIRLLQSAFKKLKPSLIKSLCVGGLILIIYSIMLSHWLSN